MAAGRRPKRGKKRPVMREASGWFDRDLNRAGLLLRVLYYLDRFLDR